MKGIRLSRLLPGGAMLVVAAACIVALNTTRIVAQQGQGGRGGQQGQGGRGGQQAQAGRTPPRPTSDLTVMPVQGFDRTKVYMVVGAGANVVVQIGDDGVLLVDTGNAESSEKLLAAIRQLTDKPIRWIINTHPHLDNVGGNAAVLSAIGGQRTSQGGGGGGVENPNGALLVSHQDAANQMMEAKPEYPDDAIPKDTFITDNKQLSFNGEGIELWEHPNAHSTGDIIVYFRKSDVIAAGGLVYTDSYPMFDAADGGTLQGMLDGMNHIVSMMIPKFNQMEGTRVIPSHGRLSDQSDIAEVRDMATIVRDRIQHMIDKGLSLEQVKAAKPTFDYDPIYGSTSGSWTTEKFLEAVYAELKNHKGPKPKSGLNFVDGGE